MYENTVCPLILLLSIVCCNYPENPAFRVMPHKPDVLFSFDDRKRQDTDDHTGKEDVLRPFQFLL